MAGLDVINTGATVDALHRDSDFDAVLSNAVVTNPLLSDEEVQQIEQQVDIDTDVDAFVASFGK